MQLTNLMNFINLLLDLLPNFEFTPVLIVEEFVHFIIITAVTILVLCSPFILLILLFKIK